MEPADMPKPSKKVLALFAEVEDIAAQLLELTAEEERLHELLERVWKARAMGMATLAVKAELASRAEVAEFAALRKGK